MRNTMILDHDGQLKLILDIIKTRLGPHYEGAAYDVEFADYGVPQRRQRLIAVFTRDSIGKAHFREGYRLIPPESHSQHGSDSRARWISVRQALQDFEPLDSLNTASAKSKKLPYHRVPVLDAKKYQWVRHAKTGVSAFDSQCVNPECLSQENPTHSNKRLNGINQSSKDTPLYCLACGSLLPRPYIDTADGTRRIMSGFTSAYKRMNPELPSPALTRNLSYPCSDNKIHPFENRVLSLAEAMELQTISRYDYRWGPFTVRNRSLSAAPDSLIRLVIGESVPPLFFEKLARHLQLLSAEELPASEMRTSKHAQQFQLLGFRDSH